MSQPKFIRRLAHYAGGAALASTALAPLLLATATPAVAQTVVGTQSQAEEVDPPGRVVRLDLFEGTVWRQSPGEAEWNAPSPNLPLGAGDRLSTDVGARAEMHLGSTALRVAGQTQIEISTLDDERAFITLTHGTLAVRVRALFPGQHLEVNTGNLAFSITQPGDYRVDVDPASSTTRIAVGSGGGVIYGENGQTQIVPAQQQMRFSGRNLAQAAGRSGVARDGFDQWTAARDRAEDQSQTARFVSREMTGYQQLDSHGDWKNDVTLGAVWYPRVTVSNWAPYRYGQWRWVGPWGWTWVDDAPWGFAPFHYGRWAQVGQLWAWVPGSMAPRPTYAPALVGFVGGTAGNVNVNVTVGGARQPGVAWFPLAPGEAYRPSYRASSRYVGNINSNVVIQRNDGNAYRFQRPETVTAISADNFQRGRPTRDSFHRMAQADLNGTRVIGGPDIRPPQRFDVPPGSTVSSGNMGLNNPPNPLNAPRQTVRDPRQNGGFQVGTQMPPGWQPDGRQPQYGQAGQPGQPGFQGGRPPGNPAAEQIRRQQREDEMQRNLTMQQRQQIQADRDMQRRAIAEQQQRSLQNGSGPDFDPQRRLDRQQDAQQRRIQNEQAEKIRRADEGPPDRRFLRPPDRNN